MRYDKISTISTRGKHKREGIKLAGLLPDKTEIYNNARSRVMTVCSFSKGNIRRQMLKQPSIRADRSVLCPGKVHVCPYNRKGKLVGNKRKGHCRKKACKSPVAH